MKKPKQSQKHRPEDDSVEFEHTSQFGLLFLLLIFSKYLFTGLDEYNKA